MQTHKNGDAVHLVLVQVSVVVHEHQRSLYEMGAWEQPRFVASSAYCGYVKEVVGGGFGQRAVGEMEVLRAIRAVYPTVARMWYVLHVVAGLA